MLTHAELKAKALEDPEARTEYERLNREEFALLDEMLAARRAAGLTQAQVAERMGTKAPAVARLENALASGKHSPAWIRCASMQPRWESGSRCTSFDHSSWRRAGSARLSSPIQSAHNNRSSNTAVIPAAARHTSALSSAFLRR